MDTERVQTGILSLDVALMGGIATDCIVEFYGPPHGGKSSLALRMIAQVQQQGHACAFLDVEHAMNKELAIKCGVDIDSLLFSQPDSGEQAFEIAEKLVKVPEVRLIVVDSVAALTPRAEIEGDYGDSHVGLQARMMSQGLRKLTSTLNKNSNEGTGNRTIVLFINQIREKIGGIGFGGPNTGTSGGRALPFYASVRVELIRTKQIKSGDDVVGHDVLAKVQKNRAGRPFTQAKFKLLYQQGISNGSSILSLAEKHALVSKGGGGWFTDTVTGEKLGHGELAVIDRLDTDQELAARLSKAILEAEDVAI